MIVGLHHAQITIPKGAEGDARFFYCDLLGLPEIEKPQALQHRGGFWLQVGDRQVHVGTEDDVERHKTKAHLAYQVSDIHHWRALLEKNHVPLIEAVPIPGYQRFEFRDPFDNRVEIIEVEPIQAEEPEQKQG